MGVTWGKLLHRAETEPINLDISDYGDEWCDGFLAGQRSVLEEVAAGRLILPAAGAQIVDDYRSDLAKLAGMQSVASVGQPPGSASAAADEPGERTW